jgi:Tol biopolymer transport system component
LRRTLCTLAATLGAATALAGQAAAQEVRIEAADGSGGRTIGGFGPAWSPAGGRIALIGGEAAQIFTVAPDGSGLARLGEQSDVAALTWSPDGTRLAYVTQTRLGVVDADGTGAKTLADDVNDDFATPSWSPDGTRLTFVRGEADRSRLAVVDADGGGLRTLRRITLDHDEGGLPRWSPDGSRIAYVDARRGRFTVFTIRPDGSGARRVGDTSCGLDPAWRPDGRRLACVGLARRGGRLRVAVNIVGRDGRIERSLAHGGRLAAPAWSPDATQLTYLRFRTSSAALHMVGADGRRHRLLTARSSALGGVPATWSPDSAQLAYGTAPQRERAGNVPSSSTE